MKTRIILAIAAVAFAIGFAGCNKENAGVPSSAEMTQLSIRINGVVSTRAVELPGSGTKGTIQVPAGNNHTVFVISPQGDVVKYVNLDVNEATSPAGQVLPASVRADSRIYIICNIPAEDVATIQTLTTFNAIKAAASQMATQSDYTQVALANLTGEPVGFNAVDGKATVNITISPLVSRLELMKVRATANANGDAISAFTVTGVYVDDYYPAFTYTGGGSGTPFAQGQGDTFTGIGDTGEWIAAGTPLAAMPDAGKLWAHQVASKGVPRFIIRLEDVKYIPNGGSEIALTETYYLTVSGYTSGINPVTNLERGKIYRIGSSNGIAFTYDDLSLVPNPIDINLTVMVSIEEWEIEDTDVVIGNPLAIKGFTPAQAAYGETLTITGTGFSTTISQNIVTLNGIPADVISATATKIEVTVPKNMDSSGTISVTVGEKSIATESAFNYLPTATVTTFAGNGVAGYVNGTGTAAQFATPSGLAFDASGNLYVSDANNHRIRKITPAGAVTTFAGIGTAGFANGAGTTAARFNSPQGLAFDASGNLYVADANNHRIRKITPAGAVTTFAGIGTQGFLDHNTAASAQFSSPSGVAFDASGNLFVVDRGNHRIRKITPEGVVTTFAGSGIGGFADGTGATAQFYYPNSAAFDASENLFVTDYYNHLIRKITPAGVVTTIAGSTKGFADGVGTEAQFNNPRGIAFDASGNMYVADEYSYSIRIITPAGVVSTVAGDGNWGYTDGVGAEAKFRLPNGLTFDALGNLYVSEADGNKIRKIVFE